MNSNQYEEQGTHGGGGHLVGRRRQKFSEWKTCGLVSPKQHKPLHRENTLGHQLSPRPPTPLYIPESTCQPHNVHQRSRPEHWEALRCYSHLPSTIDTNNNIPTQTNLTTTTYIPPVPKTCSTGYENGRGSGVGLTALEEYQKSAALIQELAATHVPKGNMVRIEHFQYLNQTQNQNQCHIPALDLPPISRNP